MLDLACIGSPDESAAVSSATAADVGGSHSHRIINLALHRES